MFSQKITSMRIRLSAGSIILAIIATTVFLGLFISFNLFADFASSNMALALFSEVVLLTPLLADAIIIFKLMRGGYALNTKSKTVIFGKGFIKKTVPIRELSSVLVCERKEVPRYVHKYTDENARKTLEAFIQKSNRRPQTFLYRSDMGAISNVGANVAGNTAGGWLAGLATSPSVLILQIGNEIIVRDMSLYEADDCKRFGELLRNEGVVVLNPKEIDSVKKSNSGNHRVLRGLWEMLKLLLYILIPVVLVFAIFIVVLLTWYQ